MAARPRRMLERAIKNLVGLNDQDEALLAEGEIISGNDMLLLNEDDYKVLLPEGTILLHRKLALVSQYI